jgi:hypothetical protein
MALTRGKSTIRAAELSLHTQTMLELLKQYIPDLNLKVTELKPGHDYLIEIDGIALTNE